MLSPTAGQERKRFFGIGYAFGHGTYTVETILLSNAAFLAAVYVGPRYLAGTSKVFSDTDKPIWQHFGNAPGSVDTTSV